MLMNTKNNKKNAYLKSIKRLELYRLAFLKPA